MRRRLTPRERQVCELLLQAKRNPEITRTIGVAEQTIKGHLGKVARIMGHGKLDRVRLALLIHDEREGLGVRCQACGER